MKLKVRREDLARELGLAQGIVEKKNTIPILSNIKLHAEGNRLELSSTDLEIGLLHGVEANVSKPGEFTVSAKKLYEIVRALPESEVTLAQADGGRLTVSCGRAQFRIVGLDPVDFPSLPECDSTGGFELPQALFSRVIQKVLFAVTLDESRFPLAGSLFLGKRDGFQMISTDGHRLSLAQASCEVKGLVKDQRHILPKKTLSELKKVAELGAETVTIRTRDNHTFFTLGDHTLISRAVEDQFPAYEKVLPQKNDIRVSFDKAELEGAVRRVSLLSSEKAGGVKFAFSEDKLRVSSSNPDLGDAQEELSCGFSAEPLEIGFNAQYVLDFLAVTETERISVELKDGTTQGLFKPEAESQEVSHQYVIMPIRI